MSEVSKKRTLKKIATDVKDVGGIVNNAVAVAGAVSALIEVADGIRESRGELVTIPSLCDKNCPLTYEQALTLLTNNKLQVVTSEVNIAEADPKYKDCFAFQVVAFNEKPGHKVKPGTSIVIRYVTQAVIDESKKICNYSAPYRSIFGMFHHL